MMWLSLATRPGECYKCGVEYSKGDAVGVISLSTAQGVIRHIAHPQCWLELGLQALGKSDHDSNAMIKEHRAARRLALHHWAQLNYREKEVRMLFTGEELDDSLSRIKQTRRELRSRMSMLGGAPKSWREG